MTMNDNIIHPLRIGNVELKNNLILAPMAGITDISYRPLCIEKGAAMTVMEMVSAKAITYNNKKTLDMLLTEPSEKPISLQIFGSEPSIMSEAVKKLEEYPFDIIDINMGCPVNKIVNNNEGSALMKDPILVGKIVESVVNSTKKPVTVKIRAGFSNENLNAPEIAKVIEESGAKAVAVHGRTREQMYRGKARLDIIRKVKESVKIPVLGNGDLRSGDDVENMYDKTHCDGFLIARGALGNPWVFKEIIDYCKNHTIDKRPSFDEIMEMILVHTKRLIHYKNDENMAIREMRKHVAYYTAGIRNSSHIRGKLNYAETLKELTELLNECKVHIEESSLT